jgi:hypothetical protein
MGMAPEAMDQVAAGILAQVPLGRLSVFRLKKHGAHFDPKIPLGLAAPDHTVPYGTDLSRDAFPGTSCDWSLDILETKNLRHMVKANVVIWMPHASYISFKIILGISADIRDSN